MEPLSLKSMNNNADFPLVLLLLPWMLTGVLLLCYDGGSRTFSFGNDKVVAFLYDCRATKHLKSNLWDLGLFCYLTRFLKLHAASHKINYRRAEIYFRPLSSWNHLGPPPSDSPAFGIQRITSITVSRQIRSKVRLKNTMTPIREQTTNYNLGKYFFIGARKQHLTCKPENMQINCFVLLTFEYKNLKPLSIFF